MSLKYHDERLYEVANIPEKPQMNYLKKLIKNLAFTTYVKTYM